MADVEMELARISTKLAQSDLATARREGATRHPFILGKIYLPHLVSAPYGAWQVEAMEMIRKLRRVAVAAPRFHGKTTLFSQVNPLHKIVTAPETGLRQMILLGASAPMAENFFRVWKNELEQNTDLRRDFFVTPGKKWTNDYAEVFIKRGSHTHKVELIAKGAGSSMRGYHPDHLHAEDLEDEEESESQAVREHLFQWFFRTVLGMMSPETTAHIIGTIVHRLSLMAELTEKPPKGWHRVRYSAIYRGKDGALRALWPEYRPMAWLEAKRAEMGSTAFASEFLNDPVSAGFQFEHKHLDYYEEGDLPMWVPPSATDGRKVLDAYTTLTLDPSMGDQDPWSITVVARNGRDWWLRAVCEKLAPPTEMIQTFWQMVSDWKPSDVGWEGIASQKLLGVLFSREEQLRRRIFFHQRQVGARGGMAKDIRIRGILQPLLEGRRLHIKREHVVVHDAILRYPKKPVDSLDSLVMHQELPLPHRYATPGAAVVADAPPPPKTGVTFQEAVDAARRNAGRTGGVPAFLSRYA